MGHRKTLYGAAKTKERREEREIKEKISRPTIQEGDGVEATKQPYKAMAEPEEVTEDEIKKAMSRKIQKCVYLQRAIKNIVEDRAKALRITFSQSLEDIVVEWTKLDHEKRKQEASQSDTQKNNVTLTAA